MDFFIENNNTYILSINKNLETEPEVEEEVPSDIEKDEDIIEEPVENISEPEETTPENDFEDFEEEEELLEDFEEEEEFEPEIEIEKEEDPKNSGQYIMVRTRKKWIPGENGIATWLIIVIGVSSALVLGGIVTATLIILKKFKGRVKI